MKRKGKRKSPSPKKNVETLGQVFTQEHTVKFMLNLRQNTGATLEPSCGDGAFSKKIADCVSIEIDKNVCPSTAICMDFFEYSPDNKFETIVGNPPFVRYKDIYDSTKAILKDKYAELFDERSNLYLFFIYKCVLHLVDGGELIFITPREFLKATSSIKLNNFLFEQGTITDMVDLGDAKLFGNFVPNCVIWRFEKGNKTRVTNYSTADLKSGFLSQNHKSTRTFTNVNGQLTFIGDTKYTVPFNTLFYVKVGAVSGADEIFANAAGNKRFVTSKTVATGKTKTFFYNVEAPELEPHKKQLLSRKIKKFSKETWYTWGRNNYDSNDKRVYVNCKTRQESPFFHHTCKNFDGSVLGIFPNDQSLDLDEVVDALNDVNWQEAGFVCDGRFIFSQKALENCMLPEAFEKFLPKP